MPRRDTLMPVFLNGTARFLGMLRADSSADKEIEETKVSLDKKYHVWDVRESKYLGYIDGFDMKLDMYPKLFALLPASPVEIGVKTDRRSVKQGEDVKAEVQVRFEGGSPDEIDNMGQVVHLKVYNPDGDELICYRKNTLFKGENVTLNIPVSYTEKPGNYKAVVEYPVTGMNATATFTVVQ